jgi:hypothetical protein
MADAGRPTEYSPKVLKDARAYLAECEDEEYDWTKTDGAQSTSYEHRVKVKLPSIEGLARHLKVHRDTLYEWEKQHVEFSDILEQVRAIQAERLINKGLSGDYNPTITKLMLTKHGYSDKQETDLTSGGKPLPLLVNLNVPNNNSPEEDKADGGTHQGDTGGDISGEDSISGGSNNGLGAEGQDPNADQHSIGINTAPEAGSDTGLQETPPGTSLLERV